MARSSGQREDALSQTPAITQRIVAHVAHTSNYATPQRLQWHRRPRWISVEAGWPCDTVAIQVHTPDGVENGALRPNQTARSRACVSCMP